MNLFSNPVFIVIAALLVIAAAYTIYTNIAGKSISNGESKSKTESYNYTFSAINADLALAEACSSLSSDELTPELVAAITAAIMASMQDSNIGLRVKSIKRIGHTTPIWNIAGRNEYILTRL